MTLSQTRSDSTPVPLRLRRKITRMSAILLAFDPDGREDWDALATHLARTAESGLPKRPISDVAVRRDILNRLEASA